MLALSQGEMRRLIYTHGMKCTLATTDTKSYLEMSVLCATLTNAENVLRNIRIAAFGILCKMIGIIVLLVVIHNGSATVHIKFHGISNEATCGRS